MRCPNKECHMQAQSGRFCTLCGTKLAELINCECGGVVYPDEKYCRYCGKKNES